MSITSVTSFNFRTISNQDRLIGQVYDDFFSLTVMPVSYTHLDVYKRQDVTSTGTMMKTMVIRTMRATKVTDYG